MRETTTAIADMALTPWVLSEMERREEAVTVYAALEAAVERLGIRVPFGEDEIARRAIGPELEQEAYPDARRRGRSMSLEELTDYVEALG